MLPLWSRRHTDLVLPSLQLEVDPRCAGALFDVNSPAGGHEHWLAVSPGEVPTAGHTDRQCLGAGRDWVKETVPLPGGWEAVGIFPGL